MAKPKRSTPHLEILVVDAVQKLIWLGKIPAEKVHDVLVPPTYLVYPTGPCTTLEPRNQKIDWFYVVQKRRATDN